MCETETIDLIGTVPRRCAAVREGGEMNCNLEEREDFYRLLDNMRRERQELESKRLGMRLATLATVLALAIVMAVML